MGKGDVKTKKGKIAKGTYGVRRPRAANKTIIAKSKPKSKATKSKPKAKAETAEKATKTKVKATEKDK